MLLTVWVLPEVYLSSTYIRVQSSPVYAGQTIKLDPDWAG